MTKAELLARLEPYPNDAEVVVSGDSAVLGDGYTMAANPGVAPRLENVSSDVFEGQVVVILWPECSWDEAFEAHEANMAEDRKKVAGSMKVHRGGADESMTKLGRAFHKKCAEVDAKTERLGKIGTDGAE